jgi:hypothetical protein
MSNFSSERLRRRRDQVVCRNGVRYLRNGPEEPADLFILCDEYPVFYARASRLIHKYRYTLIGLGPSIWLRVFIQISDPALETRLDFRGSCK